MNLDLLRFENGDEYEGFFDKGLRKGSGTLRYSDGTRRDGEWLDDKLNGVAFFHQADGTQKVEIWIEGRKTGQRFMFYSRKLILFLFTRTVGHVAKIWLIFRTFFGSLKQ